MTPEQIQTLKTFTQWVLSHHPFYGIDEFDIQHKAHELGLFELVQATEPCGDDCNCEGCFPCECYRPVEWIKEVKE